MAYTLLFCNHQLFSISLSRAFFAFIVNASGSVLLSISLLYIFHLQIHDLNCFMLCAVICGMVYIPVPKKANFSFARIEIEFIAFSFENSFWMDLIQLLFCFANHAWSTLKKTLLKTSINIWLENTADELSKRNISNIQSQNTRSNINKQWKLREKLSDSSIESFFFSIVPLFSRILFSLPHFIPAKILSYLLYFGLYVFDRLRS